MTSANSSNTDDRFLSNAMASFIQIGALLILIMLCYSIVAPFVHILLWGVVIGVGLYPTHTSLTAKLGGRAKTSATILVLIGLAIIIVPVWMTAESSITAAQEVSAAFEAGTFVVPPPNDSVASWPLVGESIHSVWSGAATNLESTLNTYSDELKSIGQTLVSVAGGAIFGALAFVVSILIAGALIMNAESGHKVAREIAGSLMGDESGEKMTELAIQTIRSIVKGVLGIAIIQAVAALVGLAVMGVPAAGLWALAVLVVAIIQLPPWLVLAPIAVWVFSVAEPVPATIFAVYMLVVSLADMVLKPMLLGRGVETPMLVILFGAIGGAMAMGIIGLFLGAVILAVSYELLVAWMSPDEGAAEA
ncbi:MAG: AI-2E family transporter [Woeseiaceae bacterium]